MQRELLLLLTLTAAAAPSGHAAWSSDAATNLPVGDGAGEQILPKVAPTADGGCYVSWFDNGSGGYDVRVQKLNAVGDEVFAHNGILVADRGFSSVQDYGLDVDASGNALVTFRDDRLTGVQITAAAVSPTGTLLWGPSGVQLTSTTAFVASPRIAGTSDGGVVVAWTQDDDSWLQKLDSDGIPLWGPGLVLSPPAGSYSPSDLHDAGSSVIVSIVHQIGSFGSPRHIVAQKLDAAGSPEWGTDPVAVFDGGSLQFGNFPPFIPDGVGGGVFSWYDTSAPQLQCYAQRIRSDGTEAFPHNGTALSTNATRVRVSPSAAFDAASEETVLFWVEETSSQSQFGVYGQKLDADGARLWTDEGAVLVGIGSDAISLVRAVWSVGGAFAFWSEAPAFNQDRLFGARVNGAGVIDVGPLDVASTPAAKSRLDVGLSTDGMAILAWGDDRNGASDVMAQNVNPDGTLGSPGVSVEIGGGAPSILLGAPYPNPSRGTVTINIAVPGSSPVGIAVHDVQGRHVRSLVADPTPVGQRVSWDGRDQFGRPVPAGVYFLRVQGGREPLVRRVTVTR